MEKTEQNNFGRPLKYATPEELAKAVDAYFVEKADKPTMSGLALHLGFLSRKSMYNYQERPDFLHIIKRARSIVEMGYEERLHTQICTGSIFALKNMGWKDEVYNKNENKNTEMNVNYDFDNDIEPIKDDN